MLFQAVIKYLSSSKFFKILSKRLKVHCKQRKKVSKWEKETLPKTRFVIVRSNQGFNPFVDIVTKQIMHVRNAKNKKILQMKAVSKRVNISAIKVFEISHDFLYFNVTLKKNYRCLSLILVLQFRLKERKRLVRSLDLVF